MNTFISIFTHRMSNDLFSNRINVEPGSTGSS